MATPMTRAGRTTKTAISKAYVMCLLCLLAAAISPGLAGPLESSPPLLGDDGLAGYREFLERADHRAFAMAPGGAWAWVADLPDPDVAEAEAVRACAAYTDQLCTVYAVDAQVVLDRDTWAASWGPYVSAEAAAARTVGTARGLRFPNLKVTAPDGAQVTISDYRDRIAILHFWGSWCKPCQAELPELQRLYNALDADNRIAFVLIQAREDIKRSRGWAGRHGITMPLFDSGAHSPSDHAFPLKDGSTIEDRILAPLFPATYVLDGNGIIVFSHLGPLAGWPEYALFLRHAAGHLQR